MTQKQIQKNSIEWKEAKLGEVAEFINGRAFKPNEWESKGKIIIRIQDLTGSTTNPHFTTKRFDNKYLVKKGDLLISWSATLDTFIWDKEEGWLNQHIFKVEEDKKIIDHKYLFYFVKRSIDLFMKNTHGSTMKHITKGKFQSIKIPIPFSNGKPDLKEQKRIVSILEETEKAKEKEKKIEKLLDEYLKSVFNEFFYNAELPIEKLKNVVSSEKNSLKRGPFGGSLKKDIFVKEGFKVYEQQNAIYKNMNLGGYYITNKKYQEMIDFAVNPGDFIISCSGTMGKISLIPEGSPKGIINQALLKIRLDGNKIENLYFRFLFESEKVQSHLFNVSHGSGISNFPPMRFIRDLQIPIPPIELQKTFTLIVRQIEKMKKNIKKTKQNSEELFDSLMQRAFRGEL